MQEGARGKEPEEIPEFSVRGTLHFAEMAIYYSIDDTIQRFSGEEP